MPSPVKRERSREYPRPQDLGIGKLFERIRDAVVVADAETQRVVLWNTAASNIFGYSPSEALKLRVEELVPKHLKARHRAGIARYAKTGEGPYVDSYRLLELPALTKSGEQIYIELSLNPIGPVDDVADDNESGRFVLAIVRDVTGRKRVQEELKASEEQFRLLTENASDIIFRYRFKPTLGFDYVSPSVKQITGYSPEEHYADPELALKIVHPEDRHLIDDVVRSPESSGGPLTLRFERKDGEVIWIEQHNNPLFDAAGDLVAVEGIARDVSARRQAEEELKENEERFRLLVEGVKDYAIFMLDPAGRVSSWNEGAHRINGYRGEEILGQHFSIFYPEAETERGRPERALEIAQAEGSYEEEGLRVRKDGSSFWASVSITALKDEEATLRGFSKVTQDITERKRAEEEIRRLNETLKELKNLLGRLVAAQEREQYRVAYEVHEGLAQVAVAAYLHLQTFSDRHPQGSKRTQAELDEGLKLIQQTISDARRITANLRPTILDDLGLAPAISLEVERLREEDYSVEYEEDLTGKQRLPAEVEVTLFRVVQEALSNVRKHAQTQRVRIELRGRKDEAYLEVRDYGEGFDPGAAPARNGAGEGLGLAEMRERVTLLGGTLQIDGAPGAGTSLRAKVPLPNNQE